MDLKRTIAIVLTLAGGALVAVGAALIYLPAGLIVAGAGLGALGFFGVDVGGGDQ